MIQWDDVDINPFGNDILVSTPVCHRDKIFLIQLVPCFRLVAFEKKVSTIPVFEPSSEGFEICIVCSLEGADRSKATQGFVFSLSNSKLVVLGVIGMPSRTVVF